MSSKTLAQEPELPPDTRTEPLRPLSVPQAGVQRARVLIVTPQPFYEDRGTPIAVRYLASALGALNVDVDLLAFPVGKDVRLRNVTVYRCSNRFGITQVPIGFSLRKLALDVSLWQAFRRLLTQNRYDVVHAVEEAAYLAATLCPARGQRFIYDMASAIPIELSRGRRALGSLLRPALESAQRHVLNSASHVVCSAGLGAYARAQAEDAMVTEWRFPALSPVVLASDLEALRQELDLRPDQRVLLYSGSFAAYQGLDLLLDAFAQLRPQHPELVLVCVGATERELARWPDLHTIGHDQLRIVGRQPRARIPVYAELADVLLLPRVGCPNVPLKLYDYMATGKPIVATRHGAQNRLLNSRRAFLCDPTPASLAETIDRACACPWAAAAVGREALHYAEQNFGWPTFVEFVRDLYMRVIARSSVRDQLRAAPIPAYPPGHLL